MAKKEKEEIKAKKFPPKADQPRAEKKLHFEELEDLPLVGGLFKGLGKLIDLAEKVEEAGGKIEKHGEIKGLTEKHPRAVWGFTISTLNKEKRPGFKVEPFGNIKKTEKGPEISEEREPIVDVFDEKNQILVIAELPGVEKNKIKVNLKGDILLIEAANSDRKYSKEVLLPAKVDPISKKQVFKNGVLEIRFNKV